MFARWIEQARQLDTPLVGTRRLHPRRAKREALSIARKAGCQNAEALRPLYRSLLGRVEAICDWARCHRQALRSLLASDRYSEWKRAHAQALIEELAAWPPLARRVLDQAQRRVLRGESVPNDEKLFSLFEPHTELLVRSKAGKDNEFGHMIQIQLVRENFITDYEVYEKKPSNQSCSSPLSRAIALFSVPIPCS